MLKNKNPELALHPMLDGTALPDSEGTSPSPAAAEGPAPEDGARDRRQSIGVVLLAVGVIVMLVAWWGVSGTADTVDQLSYIGSGVAAGACLLVVGSVLLMACEHARDREAIRELSAQLHRLEEGMAGEFDHLDQTVRSEIRRRA